MVFAADPLMNNKRDEGAGRMEMSLNRGRDIEKTTPG